jgi:hypothetical protein
MENEGADVGIGVKQSNEKWQSPTFGRKSGIFFIF